MRPDQRAEVEETPAHEDIPVITRGHVAAMEQSDADEVWNMGNMRYVMLRTTGRRSGKEHKVALPYWQDDDGHRIVIASYAGHSDHPAWYHNLTDRNVNGEVLVRVQGRSFYSEPQILDGDDYEKHWKLLVADRPFYQRYQDRAGDSRRIPMVRLSEGRPA